MYNAYLCNREEKHEKMKVVADCDIPFLAGVLEPYAEVKYIKGAEIGADDVRDADALLIRTRTLCDERLLAGSRVRFIGTATIGTDHIDLPYCADRGIAVRSAAGCNARGVLQWMAAVLVLLLRKYGMRPRETVLGVIGVGNVGGLVIRYARQWGYRVLCCDPLRRRAESLGPEDGFVDMRRLLENADIVTLHTPLTAEGEYATSGMIGAEAFGMMKNGSVLINCARGGIVDEEALLEAVGCGKVAGCAIDTWADEPDINRRLLCASDVATPHIAGYSVQGKAAGTSMTVRALARFFGFGPLSDWYPEDAPVSMPRDISWSDVSANIVRYFDIDSQSGMLKRHPEKFEEMRNGYHYREEFF